MGMPQTRNANLKINNKLKSISAAIHNENYIVLITENENFKKISLIIR